MVSYFGWKAPLLCLRDDETSVKYMHHYMVHHGNEAVQLMQEVIDGNT